MHQTSSCTPASVHSLFHLCVLDCCWWNTGFVTKETACWTCGGVCAASPRFVLMSPSPLRSRCTSPLRGGLSTVSASQGPPTERRRPASDKATPMQAGCHYRCTSCSISHPWGASHGQWSIMRSSPAECPSCFSLPQLPFEVLCCPSDTWVCRNTGKEKIWFKCNFYQVTHSLQLAALIAISEHSCKLLFFFFWTFIFFYIFFFKPVLTSMCCTDTEKIISFTSSEWRSAAFNVCWHSHQWFCIMSATLPTFSGDAPALMTNMRIRMTVRFRHGLVFNSSNLPSSMSCLLQVLFLCSRCGAEPARGS